MSNNELNREKKLLEAAEIEFLEKGYGNTKMVAIAKRANVSHSVLHYYFRSKENLFQTIFLKKIQMVSLSLEDIFDKNLPFFEMVRLIVESQFDFVAENPKLPHFILNEILSSKENRSLVFDSLSPKVKDISIKLEKLLSEEIRKGTIRLVSMNDFLINTVSINVSTFILLPIIEDMSNKQDNGYILKMLNERRESNVQFIISGLKP